MQSEDGSKDDGRLFAFYCIGLKSRTPCRYPRTRLEYSSLEEVVNVVPVIAKSDSLTIDERLNFKDRIRAELLHHNIRVYPFDTDEYDDEEKDSDDTSDVVEDTSIQRTSPIFAEVPLASRWLPGHTEGDDEAVDWGEEDGE